MSTKQILVPNILFRPKVDPQKVIDSGMMAYSKSMMFLENHLKSLGSNKFIANTDTISLADLIIITELDQIKIGVFDLYDYKTKNPVIDEYMQRVAKNLTHYDEILQPVIDIANKKLGR